MTRQFVGEVGVLAGSLLILLAAVGVLRFPDALTRMHALAKASTSGVALALIGAAAAAATVNEVMSLLFATALQAATNPVATTLLTQATYYAQGISTQIDTVDELAAYVSAAADRDVAAPTASPSLGPSHPADPAP
jgi:multicomponent Na+:H+ antiporter subunit G